MNFLKLCSNIIGMTMNLYWISFILKKNKNGISNKELESKIENKNKKLYVQYNWLNSIKENTLELLFR